MGDNIDNTTIAKELEDFQKKKEDVFKSMGMLNNLSEKLSISIHEEEKRINELQAKEIVEKKKKQSEMELELLKIENAKMENYLEILQKKQDLELQFMEKICAQKSRIEKITEKYPHIDFKKFLSYDEYYYDEVKATSHKHNVSLKKAQTKRQMYTDIPIPSHSEIEHATDKKSLIQTPTPGQPPPPTSINRVFQETSPGPDNNEIPIRRESLHDHLQSALNTKFSKAISLQQEDGNASDESNES